MNSRSPYRLFILRILGDVMSMSLSTVVVRIDGKDQDYDRNQIKKMILVERVTTGQKPVTQPASAKAKQHAGGRAKDCCSRK